MDLGSVHVPKVYSQIGTGLKEKSVEDVPYEGNANDIIHLFTNRARGTPDHSQLNFECGLRKYATPTGIRHSVQFDSTPLKFRNEPLSIS